MKLRKLNKNGVILLSGGLDSTVTLYLAKSKGYNLTALIFDYGQRHKRELEFAKKIANLNKVPFYIVKTKFPWVKSSLTDKTINVPYDRCLSNNDIPLTYVAGRNIIFLSYAFSLAESVGAKSVFIGAHTQDYSGYPDCRPAFLKNFQDAVVLGLKDDKIKLVAPLIDKDKKEIIKTGLKLKVPFEFTWSCYQGGRKPCLKCDSCRFRISAFIKLGLTDPLLGEKT